MSVCGGRIYIIYVHSSLTNCVKHKATHTDIWTQSWWVYCCHEPTRPICLLTCLSLSFQQAPPPRAWINLTGRLLNRRWDNRHPPAAKLISLCRCMTPKDGRPCMQTHITKYLHLSLSHLHGRGQEGGWLVRRRKVSALKEVHHSEVSELLFRRADGGERREGSGWEAGNFILGLVIGYQPKVCHGLQSWLASTECKSLIIPFVFHNHVLSLIDS